MRMLYGHGYAQIGIDESSYSEFANSIGYIDFVEEYNEYTTISGYFKRASKGYRAEIEVEIYNVCADDWISVRTLFENISYTKQAGLPMWIRPRYDADGYSDSLEFVVELVSNITLEDIAKTPVGQKITLVFRAVERSFALPTNTNDVTLVNWTDQNGTTYNDQSANVYQITA